MDDSVLRKTVSNFKQLIICIIIFKSILHRTSNNAYYIVYISIYFFKRGPDLMPCKKIAYFQPRSSKDVPSIGTGFLQPIFFMFLFIEFSVKDYAIRIHLVFQKAQKKNLWRRGLDRCKRFLFCFLSNIG